MTNIKLISMGVDIGTIKLGNFIKNKLNDEEYETYEKELDGNLVYVSCDDFGIDHLSKFEEGYYVVEDWFCDDKKPYISISYSTYNDFRNQICNMANGVDDSDVWCNYGWYEGKPFVEMVNFTDCDGSFDYVIAEKLLKDFESFRDKAKETLGEWFFGIYQSYIEILKQCVDCKGIVRYH